MGFKIMLHIFLNFRKSFEDIFKFENVIQSEVKEEETKKEIEFTSDKEWKNSIAPTMEFTTSIDVKMGV